MDLIKHYFPEITHLQANQFAQLQDLYRIWNEQINVVSRKDIDNLYERHVLHSLGVAKVCSFVKHSNVLDVGTGGGFPGIPLAILFPESQFHLVDSIAKKIKVVDEVSQALDLKNISSYASRAEEVKGEFDFVVSRAVTNLAKFVPWIRNKLSKTHINAIPNGLLYLKGGDLTEELKPFRKTVEEYLLSEYFEEVFFETKKVIYLPL